MLPKAHEHKNLTIEVDGNDIARYPVRTKIFMKGDNLAEIVYEHTKDILPELHNKKLTIVLGEKAVAATQGRAIPISEINPSWLAKALLPFVTKSKVGIGLGSPYTMELALRDVGIPRILLAALVAALTKPFGIKGMFYNVAGHKARSIDGPADYVIPPYNKCAVMGAINADEECQKISERMNNIPVAIIDANDIGQNVIGVSNNADADFVKKAFKDNPLGSSREQTPIAILAWD